MSDMPTGEEPRTSGGPMLDKPEISSLVPKKGQRLKRKPPKLASQKLVSISEDSDEEGATENTPNSLKLNNIDSSFSNFVPDSTPELEEEQIPVDDKLVSVSQDSDEEGATENTPNSLTLNNIDSSFSNYVLDSTPELEEEEIPVDDKLVSVSEDSDDEAATQNTQNSLKRNDGVSSFSNFVLDSTPEWSEEEISVDDIPVPTRKLKRNLPAEPHNLPVREDDEHSTDFDKVWTFSPVPVAEDDTPALPTSSKVVGSKQQADLETGVKDDSQTLWYEGKRFWLLVTSLLLLVVLIVVPVVITNNKDEISAMSPTVSPTSSPTVFMCTICPYGFTPGNPDAVLDAWGGFTCEELDTVWSESIINTTECEDFQESVALMCGCVL